MNETVRQRLPREECGEFLAFVRRKPCCACGAPAPSQAAHLRITSPDWPEKRSTGMGEKPDDRWTTPLCQDCHLNAHDAQHQVGEARFWPRVGVDPFKLADRLWRQFCRRRGRSPEQRESVVARAVRIKKRREKTRGVRPLKRGAGPGRKSKVSAPIRSRGFDKGPKRKWPSRPFNRENRDGAPRR